MSKNIKVQRDGVTETFTGVKKIQTINEQGSVTWVPYEDLTLAVKTINANGTYKASSDGYFGYSKVIVNTKGKVVGTKPNGRTYAVDTDEDEFLTETLLPDNIRLISPPTKTTFSNGEAIDISGIVVKAYSQDDECYYPSGIIPTSDLTYEPTVAARGMTSVDVYWSRPEDGEEFSVSFSILVTG